MLFLHAKQNKNINKNYKNITFWGTSQFNFLGQP